MQRWCRIREESHQCPVALRDSCRSQQARIVSVGASRIKGGGGSAGRRQTEVGDSCCIDAAFKELYQGPMVLGGSCKNPGKAESHQRHSSLTKECRISWIGVKLSRSINPQEAGSRQIEAGGCACDQLISLPDHEAKGGGVALNSSNY